MHRGLLQRVRRAGLGVLQTVLGLSVAGVLVLLGESLNTLVVVGLAVVLSLIGLLAYWLSEAEVVEAKRRFAKSFGCDYPTFSTYLFKTALVVGVAALLVASLASLGGGARWVGWGGLVISQFALGGAIGLWLGSRQ